MCEHAKLLGTQVVSVERDEAQAVRRRYLAEFADLVRAKTGREVSLQVVEGLVCPVVGEAVDVGRLPAWCVRSIDRVDPRRLAIRIEDRPSPELANVELVVSFFEVQHA